VNELVALLEERRARYAAALPGFVWGTMSNPDRSLFAFKRCGCCIGVCLIAYGANVLVEESELEWRQRGYEVVTAPARSHSVRVCRCKRYA
jgi:hypothetical protein